MERTLRLSLPGIALAGVLLAHAVPAAPFEAAVFKAQPPARAPEQRIFVPLPPVWHVADVHVPELPQETGYDRARVIVQSLLTRRIDDALALRSGSLAGDINSLDEVPDSSWYENRTGRRELEPEAVFWGPGPPDGSSAPAPDGPLTVVSSKEAGRNPGFIAEDARGHRYLVKFDRLGQPERRSGANTVGNRLLWALGYHVPEDSLFTFRREDLRIAPDATLGSGENERPLREEDLDELLASVHRNEDGTFRSHVSRFVPGKVLGPIPERGVREGDPNDLIPHEDRRSLRGLRVFAAWINHTDLKAANTLDSYVTEDGKSFVRHYLIDFDNIFAGPRDASRPQSLRTGYEYKLDPGASLSSLLTLGLRLQPWERVHDPGLRGIGPFSAEPFELYGWKPMRPNFFLSRMNDLDALWAVRKLLSLERSHVEAAVRAGSYSDPAAERYLVEVLLQRRERIARAVLGRVNPACGFRVEGQALRFVDLAVENSLAEPAAAGWMVEILARGGPGGSRQLRPPARLQRPELRLQGLELGASEQAVVRVQALRDGRPLGSAVHVHLVQADGWRLIGIDRWRTGRVAG
jgi:hypothetical protein